MMYLLARQSIFKYFRDYCDSLINLCDRCDIHDITVILYEDPTTIPRNSNYTYCFFQSIPDFFISKRAKYKLILINTEQLTNANWRNTNMLDYIKQILDMGIKVVDYDLYQSILSSNPNHLYVPYQYYSKENNHLMNLVLNTPKIYDVAFCCVGKSIRRKKIFDDLIKLNIKAVDIIGWKDDRDLKIAQSKILINIHHSEGYDIFEHYRCDRWSFAGQIIITESSASDDLLDIKDLLIIQEYDKLVDTVIQTLNSYDDNKLKLAEKLEASKTHIIDTRSSKFYEFVSDLSS